MKESTLALVFMLGGIIGIACHNYTTRDQAHMIINIEKQIKECEATLPRNEHCVLVALPVSKD